VSERDRCTDGQAGRWADGQRDRKDE